MEELTLNIENLKSLCSLLIIVVVQVVVIIRVIRKMLAGDKTAEEALMIMLNILKDDKKMVNGKRFDLKINDKIDAIGDIIKTSNEAKNKVKNIINKVNKRKGLIKVGSYKGKEIYATDLLNLGSALKKLF